LEADFDADAIGVVENLIVGPYDPMVLAIELVERSGVGDLFHTDRDVHDDSAPLSIV
jgi:hypothetical protein